MKLNNILVLFTDDFPFDQNRTHLNYEKKYLFEAFDKVYIFSSHAKTILAYELPSHVIAYSIPISLNTAHKFKSFKYLFSPIFYNELFFMIKKLNLSPTLKRMKCLLSEIYKAFILYKFIRTNIEFEFKTENHLYVYSFWNNYTAATAALLKIKYPLIRAISRAHGWDVYFERTPENYLPLKSFILKNLDAIYYISEHGYLYSRKKFGNFPNLKIARLGSQNYFLPDFKKQRKPFHLISISNIIPLKRIDLIIQALNLISKKYLVKWTHIGDGPLASKMKDLALDLISSKTNISYHFTGYISNNEVLEFFGKENVSLFINVSSTEGIPVSIMEAMSCGIPVVATNVGGTGEIVKDGVNGSLLVENPSPKEIADVIEKFISLDDNTYQNFCKSAFQNWSENFNANINHPAFIHEIFNL